MRASPQPYTYSHTINKNTRQCPWGLVKCSGYCRWNKTKHFLRASWICKSNILNTESRWLSRKRATILCERMKEACKPAKQVKTNHVIEASSDSGWRRVLRKLFQKAERKSCKCPIHQRSCLITILQSAMPHSFSIVGMLLSAGT